MQFLSGKEKAEIFETSIFVIEKENEQEKMNSRSIEKKKRR